MLRQDGNAARRLGIRGGDPYAPTSQTRGPSGRVGAPGLTARSERAWSGAERPAGPVKRDNRFRRTDDPREHPRARADARFPGRKRRARAGRRRSCGSSQRRRLAGVVQTTASTKYQERLRRTVAAQGVNSRAPPRRTPVQTPTFPGESRRVRGAAGALASRRSPERALESRRHGRERVHPRGVTPPAHRRRRSRSALTNQVLWDRQLVPAVRVVDHERGGFRLHEALQRLQRGRFGGL